jgi:hypothetical protein
VEGVDGRPRLERFGVDGAEGTGEVEAVEIGRSGEGDVDLRTFPGLFEVCLEKWGKSEWR